MAETSASRHVIVIAEEELFPTHHGGLLATVNEVDALRSAGFDVTVVVPHIGDLANEQVRRHQDRLGRVLFVKQRGKLRATTIHPWLPYVSSRRLPVWRDLQGLLKDLSSLPQPAAVVAVHEYTLPLAKRIITRVPAPLVLRSQNDEVAYLRGIARSTGRLRWKLLLHADVLRLRACHRRMLGPVRVVALISPHDEGAFARLGARTVVVPPTLSSDVREASGVPPFEGRLNRLVFVGALDVPHTAEGIAWFAREVMPLLRDRLPGAQLEVIGRGASPAFLASMAALPGVLMTGEVDSLDAGFDTARVFVNPVFSGSGVNMKVGPPAAAGVPIVTTSFGLRGLDSFRGAMTAADDPEGLARLCLELLEDPLTWQERSSATLLAMRNAYTLPASSMRWRRLVDLAQVE